MPGLEPHHQMLLNELASVIEAHTAEPTLEKIDWSTFLNFLIQLFEMLGPIIIPLLVKPPEPPTV